MKAAYTRYGPPDVVQIMEVEKPVRHHSGGPVSAIKMEVTTVLDPP